jgi:hypothetical protein
MFAGEEREGNKQGAGSSAVFSVVLIPDFAEGESGVCLGTGNRC